MRLREGKGEGEGDRGRVCKKLEVVSESAMPVIYRCQAICVNFKTVIVINPVMICIDFRGPGGGLSVLIKR